MPPLVIDELTRRQFERKYHPTTPLMSAQQLLPGRQPESSAPNSQQETHERFAEQPASYQSSSRISPHSTASTLSGTYQERRSLPPRTVTDETFDDAYVSFILYCNPTVPPHTDTTELRKTFRAPPRSDGKAFSTFTLFELIRKLEMKEIKTWAQLALDLGVEPPALDKGQSAQKVQQYAVRLKRWMHAMHVDAFFEFLLNKPHVYWTHVPSIHEPPAEVGRDGVVAEEDLALRALLPETKPKRGRRKAGEMEDDESEMGKSPAQRPRLQHSPTLSEDFMIARAALDHENPTPASGHPAYQAFDDRLVPWSATDVRAPLAGSFRWGAPRDSNMQTPLSAYPQSAITPTTKNVWHDANEPRSAIAPNKSRSKRRHGPAVSSAWPSNSSTSTGKLRGRPPSNRSVQDGPFSTFPANPNVREGPTINVRDDPPSATPVVEEPQDAQFFLPGVRANPPAPPNPPNPTTQNSKPSRLQLQVPQRQGGAVRLATPPPVLLVNDESGPNLQTNSASQVGPMMGYYGGSDDHNADFQPFVNITIRQNEDSDRTNVDSLESHFICEILAAEWYDAAGLRIEKCSIDEASKICKQVIRNLQAESGSPEAFLMSVTALAGGPLRTHVRMTKLEENDTKTDYECHWRMRFGSIEGDFTIRAAVQHSVATAHGPDDEEIQVSWKKRYLDLQQRIRERDEKVELLKKNILDALVASNQMMLDRRGESYPRIPRREI